MGFLSALFGGKQETPEEKEKNINEKNFNIFKYDGVKAAKIGQFEYAIRCYNEALQIHDDLETRDYLARALTRTGRLDEAIEQLQILTDAEPDNVALLLQVARIYHLKEDYTSMDAICNKAMQMAPANAEACFLSAQAQMGMSNAIQAVALLTKALTLNPGMGIALMMRSKALLQLGDIPGATADADQLVRANPGNEDVLMLKARVELKAGNHANAIAIYSQVIELNPFCVEAFTERGQARYESGDTKGAQEDLKKVLEINPEALADVSGEYSAEGIEHKVKQAYSFINPLGI